MACALCDASPSDINDIEKVNAGFKMGGVMKK